MKIDLPAQHRTAVIRAARKSLEAARTVVKAAEEGLYRPTPETVTLTAACLRFLTETDPLVQAAEAADDTTRRTE